MRNVLIMIIIALVLVFTLAAEGTGEESTQEQGEREQESVMSRARAAYPTPQVDDFLTRKAVTEWMRRMDQPGKIFYIYIIADTGAITHYFVAQYRPVSVATYLTPTERIHDDYDWGTVVQSPSLDGVYYGKGASDQYFFFDAETDAYIELKGLNYIVSDQPFETRAPRIHIAEAE